MKKIYHLLFLPILITLSSIIVSCGTRDIKNKFGVAKVKIISTDVFPTEESNGNQVISGDLINLLTPSSCNCADETPLIINSDFYRVDTAAHQKIFNSNDVSKFAGNTSKLEFWQNKAKIINTTPIDKALLQPTQPNNLRQKIEVFILKNSKEDSVFVLANSTKKYILNGKLYSSFDNTDSVRKKIEQVYQKNPKVSFTIILNPPTEEVSVVNCTKWTTTGNQKCINNVSYIEEKCETGEVRWVKGGKVNCPIKPIGFISSKKSKLANSNNDLPPALPIQGIKVDAIKEGNTKDLKLKSKTNQ